MYRLSHRNIGLLICYYRGSLILGIMHVYLTAHMREGISARPGVTGGVTSSGGTSNNSGSLGQGKYFSSVLGLSYSSSSLFPRFRSQHIGITSSITRVEASGKLFGQISQSHSVASPCHLAVNQIPSSPYLPSTASTNTKGSSL